MHGHFGKFLPTGAILCEILVSTYDLLYVVTLKERLVLRRRTNNPLAYVCEDVWGLDSEPPICFSAEPWPHRMQGHVLILFVFLFFFWKKGASYEPSNTVSFEYSKYVYQSTSMTLNSERDLNFSYFEYLICHQYLCFKKEDFMLKN